MTLTTGQLLLLVTLIAPAVGAVAAATVSARSDRAGRLLAAGAAGVAFLASVGLVFDRADGGTGAIRPWHDIDYAWAPGLDLRFHIGVDGVSYPLVVLTTLLTLLCAIYTCWHVPVPDGEPAAGPARGRMLAALLLVIEVGIVGTFLALDLVLFFVFFEVVLLPMYAVIASWGGPAAPARRPEVRALHAVRLRAAARRRLHRRGQRGHRGSHRADHHRRTSHGPRHPADGVHPVRRCLRREESTVATAHLAAGRAHRGPDRRLGDPGRRAAEDGHVRPAPGRPSAWPRPARPRWLPCWVCSRSRPSSSVVWCASPNRS